MTKPAVANPGLSTAAATPVLFPAFDYQPLGRVVYGAGELARLGELVREYGGTRVLLVTDPGIEAAGHPQKALRIMRAAGLEVFVFDSVEENPETGHIVQGVEVAKQHGIDFLVAVGGGSSMDVAKGINFLLTNGGRMTDYRGYGKATKPMLPSIGVPTTSGTGSEAQSFALIADTSSHMKMACGDRKAAFRVALLDPELTISQPHSVTAITGIDALAHAVESFVCTKRSPLSQTWSLAAWRFLEPDYERVLEAPYDLPGRSAMQIGSHLAGLAIEASMLGAAHACANPLSAHYGLTHGIAVGVLLPHVVRFNAVSVGHLYAELVECAGRSSSEPACRLRFRPAAYRGASCRCLRKKRTSSGPLVSTRARLRKLICNDYTKPPGSRLQICPEDHHEMHFVTHLCCNKLLDIKPRRRVQRTASGFCPATATGGPSANHTRPRRLALLPRQCAAGWPKSGSASRPPRSAVESHHRQARHRGHCRHCGRCRVPRLVRQEHLRFRSEDRRCEMEVPRRTVQRISGRAQWEGLHWR